MAFCVLKLDTMPSLGLPYFLAMLTFTQRWQVLAGQAKDRIKILPVPVLASGRSNKAPRQDQSDVQESTSDDARKIGGTLATGILFCFMVLQANAQPKPLLPDPALTPGSVRTNTVEGLLSVHNTAEIRNVPERIHREAFNRYGIPYDRHVTQNYEVDHLISLELGGDNSISNLWPQSYLTLMNAHIKDKLENFMARTVKAEAKTNRALATATLQRYQREIATNWIAAYTNHLLKGQP